MAEYGHGYHWECLVNLDDLVKVHLPNLLKEGKLEDKTEVNAIFFGDGIQSTETIFTIALESTVSAIAIIVPNRERTANEFVSGYPFIKNGDNMKLKIIEIKEWPNKYEAVIVTETEDEREISFFDTKYYKNKNLYQIGKFYTFSISALGYNIEKLKDKTFSFEGQKAVDWLAKIGKEANLDSLGNVEPVTFDLSNLVSFLPKNNEFPDDAEFQSPIYKIENIDAFQTKLYKLNIQIYRDPDIFVNLFAKQEFFEEKPTTNDSVRGFLWLQGYLVNEKVSLSNTFVNSDGEPIIIDN